MKKMFLLFSHKLTQAQIANAKEQFGVEEFVYLSDELQHLWSNIPPDIGALKEYLVPIKNYLSQNLKKDDVALIQGDFGATCQMANFVKSLGAKAVYATTRRSVQEKTIDGKVVKTSVFEHVRFREFVDM